ncbi:MAG TPA: aminodeoxychorismate synthase component I [Cyanothece sp. UBA12306]|nr:aminodeoxychorismate synthase component I [Cyanothece sp. UBA12306]
MKTLLIDNYDSYTFNLYQLIATVNSEPPFVIHNDQISWQDLTQLDFDNVVISPGPGHPASEQDFGICKIVLQRLEKPILGVCLGHQGLGHVFGGTVSHAPEVRHGRISHIYHQKSDLFNKIPSPFSAVRYHSLIVNQTDLPDCLEIIAWTEDRLIMGLRHRQKPIFGVQFHPESICTDYGYQLLENFQAITTISQLNQNSLKIGNQHHTISSRVKTIIPSRPTTAVPKKLDLNVESTFKVFVKKLGFVLDAEQVFVHIYGNSPYAFWLDSSQVEEDLSRFSFMGNDRGHHSLRVEYDCHTQIVEITQNHTLTQKKASIFDYLQEELDRRFCATQTLPFDFNCGFVGYFGYELKLECGAKFAYPFDWPDAVFLLATQMIAFDHQEQTTYLLYFGQSNEADQAEIWFEQMERDLIDLPPLAEIQSLEQQEPVLFRFSRSHQTYLQDIEQCLKEIYNGESYEICLTNQLYTNGSLDALNFYRHLRHHNPSPYAAFLRFGDLKILCSSPERFLKVDRDGWVETKPIKGTLPRGIIEEEDVQIREQLANSEKDRAENLMVLDLLRNDLGLVCEVGSIEVPKLMEVETYATVHQLVSTVRGHLRRDLKVTDCIRAAFPGGSMTGAPKLRTMEIIDRLEGEARGIYSGAIGFLALNGTADLNIVIRTAIVTPTKTSIGVGGGIIALSDPQLEFEEILLKAKALIHSLVETVQGKGWELGALEEDGFQFSWQKKPPNS